MSELAFVLIGGVVAIHGAARAAWSPCGQSMLASLTPVAEAARGQSWRITVAAFAVGAVLAGTTAGLLWGAVGTLLPGTGWRAPFVVAVLVAALAIDGTRVRRSMPLTRRQVNEDWMHRYRGWVYGLGFGAQLGFGFITLVACAAIYATFAIELASGSITAGALIGAVFGVTKAATLAPTWVARDHRSLLGLHRRLLGLERPAQRLLVAAELLALVATVGLLV
jgi:MFS family permease